MTISPTEGRITSHFGPRNLPGALSSYHKGTDIAAPVGTPVRAPLDGTVRLSGYDPQISGKYVFLNHGTGIETWHVHMDTLAVRTGDKVKRGQLIGTVGHTGNATGPNLHTEVRLSGIPVDPVTWYRGRGIDLGAPGSSELPPTDNPVILRAGSRGTAVRQYQREMNRVFPAYSRLTVDGIYGPRTEAVTREFQRRAGLTADGIVGARTRSALARYGVRL